MKKLNYFIIFIISVIVFAPKNTFALDTDTIDNINTNFTDKEELSSSGEIISYENKKDISISYQAHVQTYGWQDYVTEGNLSGTTGQSKRLEGFIINLENNSNLSGNVEYKSYVKGVGWQDYVTEGNLSGTTGEAKQIEAFKIKLTGSLALRYDIYYRAHVSHIGWLGWAKNNEVSGTLGYDEKIEALEIRIFPKNSNPNLDTTTPSKEKEETLSYSSYIASTWQNTVTNGTQSGTTGESKPIEAIKVSLSDYEDLGGYLEYSTLVRNSNWQNYVTDGNISGTINEQSPIEAIKIRLKGNISNYYDIYYRVHSQHFGWLGWAKNDEIAGTINYYYRIEAIEIKLVKKGTGEKTGSSSQTNNTTPMVIYQTHSQSYGWSTAESHDVISGTIGQSKRVEAVKIGLYTNGLSGSIEYQSHIQGYGWESTWKKDYDISGTTGEARRLEAIRIRLTGEMANKYDIYYRVHSQHFGWLDWAKNGENAGTEGYGYRMEAIQIVLVEKGGAAPGLTTTPYTLHGFYTASDGYTHYRDSNGNDVIGWMKIGSTRYFFNKYGQLIGDNVKKIIDVSAHQKEIDWDTLWNSGEIDGVIIRVGAGSAYYDSYLGRNISAVKRLGIPYGLYLYSYAEDMIGTVSDLGTMHEASLEASRILKAINDYGLNPSLGIYYDLETWESGRNGDWTGEEYRPLVDNFGYTMSQAGLGWYIYTGKYKAEKVLYNFMDRIRWIAQYNEVGCTYTGTYNMWQYTSTAYLPGISGTVDVSILY